MSQPLSNLCYDEPIGDREVGQMTLKLRSKCQTPSGQQKSTTDSLGSKKEMKKLIYLIKFESQKVVCFIQISPNLPLKCVPTRLPQTSWI